MRPLSMPSVERTIGIGVIVVAALAPALFSPFFVSYVLTQTLWLGIAAVSVLAPEVVRVRFSPASSFGRDHSYAVVSRELGDPNFTVRTEGEKTVVATRALNLTLTHAPFRVAVASASGESLDEDDADLATAINGRRFKVWKRLRADGYTFFIERRAGGRPRLGILVSRKHSAAAIGRNRLKRCIREAFRLEQEKLGPVDVLVRPPERVEASPEMMQRLRKLLGELDR